MAELLIGSDVFVQNLSLCIIFHGVYFLIMFVIVNIPLHDNDRYKMVQDWVILFLL